MALYSSHTSMVQRSKGQNAVAAAAYNARTKLELEVVDKLTGVTTNIVYDYSQKGGLAYSKITAPDEAPDWVYDHQTLWNAAEKADRRKDSQPGRKIIKALPLELNLDQQIALAEEFTRELVSMGMVVDANIHNDKEGNPHLHLIMTTRDFIDNRYGEKVFGNKNREWGKRAFIRWHRKLWADLTNEHLALHGFEARVSEKSYKDRGLDLVPGVHQGPASYIKNAELVEVNRQIAEENARRIEENPNLILDKLSLNKPVFTKEEIAAELEKYLAAGIDFEGKRGINFAQKEVEVKEHESEGSRSDESQSEEGKVVNEVENKEQDAEQIREVKAADVEALNEEYSRRYMLAYERIMSSPELSLVIEKDLKDRELYTTTKRLELEERFIGVVEHLRGRADHALRLSDGDLDVLSLGERIAETVRGLAEDLASKLERQTGLKFTVAGKKPELSAEQRAAVLGILNGADISALWGLPGAGKTTAMQEIVRQYKKAGYKVIGVTASSSAALQLAKTTGIECKNASLWRKEWLKANGEKFEVVLRGDYYKEAKYIGNKTCLTSKQVVIVDEASMMELANMDYISQEVSKAGAKLIKIGDNNQLSAVGWAGAFKKVIDICGAESLEEARRQQNPIHQEATRLLGYYRIREALDLYFKEGNILINESEFESRQRLMKDYMASYLQKSAELKKDNLVAVKEVVICTYTNKEAARLNSEIRELLKEAGVIKGREKEVLVGDKHLLLAKGEQIVFTRNFNRLGSRGIYNGEVGTVLGVSKPDKLGAAAVAILVNKADGNQERIVLDTADYSKGNLFDYGYAVTGHKLQGATVEELFVMYDRQVGYEAFNVMMTRHRKEVKLYANAEELIGTLYESLDLDRGKAQSRYELTSETVNLALEGLVKTVSKRVNNSFAKDYADMGLRAEDKILKRYIEKNKQVLEIIKTISLWQQSTLRLTGKKPPLHEHKFWPGFKLTRMERNTLVSYITKDYETYKDRIIQLGMNYATIEKHADGKTKYLVAENLTYLHLDSANYQQLVAAIESDVGLIAKRAYQALRLEIAESYAKLQEVHTQLRDVQEDEHDLKDAIEAERNYREVLLPAFLSRIYREPSEQVIANYQHLVKEHGEERAVVMVEKKPSLLGSLKGFGIGQIIGFTGSRRDAISVSENLAKQLTGYNNGNRMEKQLAAELTISKFEDKMNQLQAEIRLLKGQLPSSLDEAFLNQAGEVLEPGRISGSGEKEAIDLSIIRKSDLFHDIWLRRVQDEGEKREQEQEEKQHIQNKEQGKEQGKEESKETINLTLSPQSSRRNTGQQAELHSDSREEKTVSNLSINSTTKSKIVESSEATAVAASKEHVKDDKQEVSEQSKSQHETNDGLVTHTEDKAQKVETVLDSAELKSQETDALVTFKESAPDNKHQHDEALEPNKGNHRGDEVQPKAQQEVAEPSRSQHEANADEQVKAQPKVTEPNVDSKLLARNATRKAMPVLDFDEVKRAVTPSVIEQVFRNYGQQLNPDGKIGKKGQQLFCGSLNINLKDGRWYRFSDGSKGDIFGLVKEAAGVDTKGAFEIVGRYAGVPAKAREGKTLGGENTAGKVQEKLEEFTKLADSSRDPWQAYSVISVNVPKFNPAKNLYGTLKHNNWRLEATYEYKNRDGELIGYVVRVLDKDGKKQTLPVTYCQNTQTNKEAWRLKGFNDDGYKPIYRAEKLISRDKPVLVVEGEKTVEAAAKILPDHTVISWLGGAQGVGRVNWGMLKDREVVIWPDNDAPGKGAAKEILSLVNKANGHSGRCSIVDVKALGLPNKWDLADKLPERINLDHIRAAISSCQSVNKSLEDHLSLAKNFSQQDQQLFWQQASIGVLEPVSAKETANLRSSIKKVLSSSEVIAYTSYAEAIHKLDSGHNFLDFKDAFYRECLSSSIASFLTKHEGSATKQADTKRVSTLFSQHLSSQHFESSITSSPGVETASTAFDGQEKSRDNLVEIVSTAVKIYEKSRDSVAEHKIISCHKFKENHEEFASTNPAKADFYRQLMKDFTHLHLEELGMKELSAMHQEKLSASVASVLKSYDTNYKGRNLPLDGAAYKAIASTAHAKINNPDWWQGAFMDNKNLATNIQNKKIESANRELKQTKDQVKAAIKEAGIEDKGQIKAVHARAIAHAFEYMYYGGRKSPAIAITSACVERAIYEEKHITRCMLNAENYMMKDGRLKQLDTAGGKIFQQIMAERLVKAESYINQKQPELQVHEIRAKAEGVYFTHQKEVSKLLANHPAIGTLKEESPLAAKYLAEDMLEFKHHYEEELLTPERIRVMSEIARKQAEIAKEVEKQMLPHDNEITSGKHKNLSPDILTGQIVAFDREMTAKSVAAKLKPELNHELLIPETSRTHSLDHETDKEHRLSISSDHHNILHHEDLSRAGGHNLLHDIQHEMVHSISQTRNMQQEYHEQKHEEHQKSLNNHYGMGIED